jgi:hypothetical protein
VLLDINLFTIIHVYTFKLTHLDFCVGSSDVIIDDIFPCTWVGYNISGEVKIKNGQLLVNDIAHRNISELKQMSENEAENAKHLASGSKFNMEPGRTLFVHMKICNEAMRCKTRLLGSVVITNDNTQMITSTTGKAIRVEIPLLGAGRRRKRQTNTLSVDTPDGKNRQPFSSKIKI